MGIRDTINMDDWINSMFLNNGECLVSVPINGTHPYERFGKQVIKEVYKRCQYKIIYGPNRNGDRIHIFHQTAPK